MLLLPKPDPAAHALDVLLISEAPAQRLDDCLTHLRPALAAYDGPVTLRLLVQGQPPGGLAGLEAAGDATHAFRVCITRVPSWIGRPAAYNWLLTESTAPWVACLTDEIRVPADAFNRLLSTLQRQPEALAAGGPMLPIPAGVHRVIYPGDGRCFTAAPRSVAPQFDIRYTPAASNGWTTRWCWAWPARRAHGFARLPARPSAAASLARTLRGGDALRPHEILRQVG
jgi:hypothetical protein